MDSGNWLLGAIPTPEEDEADFKEYRKILMAKQEKIIFSICGTAMIAALIVMAAATIIIPISMRAMVKHWYQWPCLVYIAWFFGAIVGGLLVQLSFFITDAVLKVVKL